MSSPGAHHPAHADETAALPSFGQEAVVGPVLVAAEHLDQLALLVPDVGAPPVPTATELAALLAPSPDPLAPLAPVGDGAGSQAQPIDTAVPIDHPPDATGAFSGHVFVTASPVDPGTAPLSFDGPALHLNDPIVSPSLYQPAGAPPLFAQHVIPQDHNLIAIAAAPAPVTSLPDTHPQIAAAPAPVTSSPDTHPPIVPAQSVAAPTPHATAHANSSSPVSGGDILSLSGGGSDTITTGGFDVSVVGTFAVSPAPHSTIGLPPSPSHTLNLQPSDGGYNITEDGRLVTLLAGETLATGSGDDYLAVGVGAHGAVTIDAHGWLILSGTVNGDLSVTATGTITESGPLSINGNATLSAGGAIIPTSGTIIGGHLTVAGAGMDTFLAGSFFKNAPLSAGAGYSFADGRIVANVFPADRDHHHS